MSEGQTIIVDVDYLNTSTSVQNYGQIRITGKCSYVRTAEDSKQRYTKAYVDETGMVGGWEKSEMRKYFKETIKPLIPENVRSHIVPVSKSHPAYSTEMKSVTQTTVDDVWLPSYAEMFSSYSNGGIYRSLFADNASRVKKKVGAASASRWWLRAASSINGAYAVGSSGSYTSDSVDTSWDVPLGFSHARQSNHKVKSGQEERRRT